MQSLRGLRCSLRILAANRSCYNGALRRVRHSPFLAFSTESSPVCCCPCVNLSTCALVLAILVSWPSQVVWAQLQQLASHPAGLSTSESMLARAKSAEQELSEGLHTVVARGRIRNTVYSQDLTSPKVTLDADVQVYYDAPKFLLWMQYADDLSDDSRSGLFRQSPSDEELAARVAAQILLFDGQTLTTVRRSGDGNCRGDIYFDFHRPNQLRSAGFPFENPIELWREPLVIDRADLLHTHTTPLANGGFVGELIKDTYRLKFYFLGNFGYDLRRVSFYGIGQEVPFRDWHLTWQQTAGVHYVERLVRRVNAVAPLNEPLGNTSTVREQSELEYSQFDLPLSIDADVFELSSLDLPDSTPFHDHRVNVEGKPKVVWWRQGQLQP